MVENELLPPPMDTIPIPDAPAGTKSPAARNSTTTSKNSQKATSTPSTPSNPSTSTATATVTADKKAAAPKSFATSTKATTTTATRSPPAVNGTFSERLRKALNGTYTPNMRRSVQSCVLFEADRCLNMQYKRLKAFQRKVALHDTASDIVETLIFIPPHYRIEIMYRTNTKRELLTPELSWRRMRSIDRDIKAQIIPKVLQMNEPGKTHAQICSIYLQKEYENLTGRKDPYHPNWEYSHDNHFTAYRMFYFGTDLNPRLPPAVDPNPNRVVPSVKPKPEEIHAENMKRTARAAEIANQAQRNAILTTPSNKKAKTSVASAQLQSTMARTQINPSTHKIVPVSNEATERRELLKEIKDHIDILNEFTGIIPPEILLERKKALFAMLPSPKPLKK